MQAYKLKGKIDQSGNLLITELVNLPPGNVEIIVWPATDTFNHTTSPTSEPAPETPKRMVQQREESLMIWEDVLLGELAGLWSCSVAYDCRIIFNFSEDEKLLEMVILLIDIGSHDEVY